MEADPAELLRAQAERAVRMFKETLERDVAYDQAGVALLDDLIEELREGTKPEQRERFIVSFGAFVGEAIIRVYGGLWKEREGTWGVEVGSRMWVNPIGKVRKQFQGGDSVLSLFDAIPGLLAESREEA